MTSVNLQRRFKKPFFPVDLVLVGGGVWESNPPRPPLDDPQRVWSPREPPGPLRLPAVV